MEFADIHFGTFFFTSSKYEDRGYAWYVKFCGEIVLEGKFGPYLTRREVFQAAPIINNQISDVERNSVMGPTSDFISTITNAMTVQSDASSLAMKLMDGRENPPGNVIFPVQHFA